MLSFNTTDRLQQANNAIAASPVINLQAAFYRRLLEAHRHLAVDDSEWVSCPMPQDIALAPKLSLGQMLTAADVPRLVELMFEAYKGYVTAYRDAGFPAPVHAAFQAMQSYEVTCT